MEYLISESNADTKHDSAQEKHCQVDGRGI